VKNIHGHASNIFARIDLYHIIWQLVQLKFYCLYNLINLNRMEIVYRICHHFFEAVRSYNSHELKFLPAFANEMNQNFYDYKIVNCV
jgi:hypothetical protein